MIIEEGIRSHPKFKALARAMKSEQRALWVLFLLWSHCRTGQRGGNWGRVSVGYVESVCEWTGRPGELFEALKNPYGPGGEARGWVVEADGCVVVHGWEELHWRTVTNWENAKKRRKGEQAKTPINGARNGSHSTQSVKPSGSMDGPNANNGLPIPCGGSNGKVGIGRDRVPLYSPSDGFSEKENGAAEAGGREQETEAGSAGASPHHYPPHQDSGTAEIPTAEEMFAVFQATGAGVTLELCRRYAEYQSENRGWIKRNGLGEEFVRPWRAEVPRWQARERKADGAWPSRNGHGRSAREELEDIGAELQWQRDEERKKALVQRRKELRGE